MLKNNIQRMLLLSLLVLIMAAAMPMRTYAATIQYWLNYNAAVDQYRLDFTYPMGTASYELAFTSETGTPYTLEFNNVPSKILYLTCNGTYTVNFFNASSTKIGYFSNVVTTQIVNPTCNSYSGQTGQDDLLASSTQTPDQEGNYTMQFEKKPFHKYDIYKDGALYEADNETGIRAVPAGSYTIIEKDANGVETGLRSDLVVPTNYQPAGSVTGTGDDVEAYEDPNACASLICECIQALQPALNEINDNTNGQLLKLDELKTAVNAVKTSVDAVKVSVDAVKDELHPDGQYPVKTVNDYDLPVLEDNQPLENPAPEFTDNDVHFTDAGDAAEPTAFPVAPEPATSWKVDELTLVTQEPVLQQDPVLEKDDVPIRDPILEKDPEMVRDPILQRDEPLIQDTTVYPLRWKSEEYSP